MSDSYPREPTPGPSLEGRGDDDPEIEALLGFEPVPRKVEVEGGWTPELQREFIGRLAAHGSANKACDEMGKNRTGLTKLYNNPQGASFRTAWDGAVALARRRKSERETADYVSPGTRPPTIDHRVKAARPPTPPHRGEGSFEEDEEDPDEEQKWALLHNIGVKFMRKVAAEREARLAGRIVAADFYLRQITFIEITFDLTATAFGWDAGWALKKLRRGKYGIMQIANTELADWLDQSRRQWWAQEGDPARPPHPDVRFLEPHWSPEGEYATNVDQHATGALTTPARGFLAEEWAEMSSKEQLAARQAQFDEDAVEQRAYERRAYEDWRARESTEGSDADA